MIQSNPPNKTISFPFTPQIKALFNHLLKNGDEVRIVGGAVRDFIDKKTISDYSCADFDLACQYTPEKTIDILKANHIKTVASGLKYGTITAIIDQMQFQITTLRKEIKHYGRDCEVEFVDNFFEDAKRRDFTINAISVDFSGKVYDYFGGIYDLENQIVRFIGDADERIQEDYLRILRFFRFSCQYAKTIDILGLEACIAYKTNLKTLSCERIRSELFKMFGYKNRDKLCTILQIMFDSGILTIIFDNLEQKNLDSLRNLFTLEKFLDHKFTTLVILAVLSGKEASQLRLSSAEKNYLQKITNPKFDTNLDISEKNLLKLLLKFDKEELSDAFVIRLVLDKNFQKFIDDFIQINTIICSAKIPNFPIDGYDLINLKIKPQDIGKTIEIAKNYWWENNFSITKQDILAFIKNRAELT